MIIHVIICKDLDFSQKKRGADDDDDIFLKGVVEQILCGKQEKLIIQYYLHMQGQLFFTQRENQREKSIKQG